MKKETPESFLMKVTLGMDSSIECYNGSYTISLKYANPLMTLEIVNFGGDEHYLLRTPTPSLILNNVDEALKNDGLTYFQKVVLFIKKAFPKPCVEQLELKFKL